MNKPGDSSGTTCHLSTAIGEHAELFALTRLSIRNWPTEFASAKRLTEKAKMAFSTECTVLY